MTDTSPLNARNYLNAAAYVANVVVTYAIGAMGLFGAKSNSELSEKYQTLVTPAGWAFSIWGIIFIFQLIFTIVQLLPAFRASALVQEGVKYYYVGVCLAQVAWTLFFSFEIIFMSLVMMLTILAFLVLIVTSQYKVEGSGDSSLKDFWLLKFPFSIHCGWITAASFVNISVYLVSLEVSAGVQVFVAIASLVGVVIAASVALFKPIPPEFVIPCVLIWATAAIGVELRTPKDLIVLTFSESTISMIRYGAFATSALIALLTVVSLVRQWRSSSETSSPEEGEYLRASGNGKMS